MLGFHPLGAVGLQRFNDELSIRSDWNPTMPVSVALNGIDLEFGTVLALVETPVLGDIYAFDSWNGNGSEETVSTITRLICEYVHADPNHCCLIDEQLIGPSDPVWLNDLEPEFERSYLLCNNSILYCILRSNCNEDFIRKIVQNTFRHYSCFAQVECENELARTEPRNTLLQREIDEAVAHAQAIIVDAYDLEGCLIWIKKEKQDMLTLLENAVRARERGNHGNDNQLA